MEYMESKMQDLIQGGIEEQSEMLQIEISHKDYKDLLEAERQRDNYVHIIAIMEDALQRINNKSLGAEVNKAVIEMGDIAFSTLVKIKQGAANGIDFSKLHEETLGLLKEKK